MVAGASGLFSVDTGLAAFCALDVPNPAFRDDQSGTDGGLWASQVAFVE